MNKFVARGGNGHQCPLHEEGIPLDQVAGILQPLGLRLLVSHGSLFFLFADTKGLLRIGITKTED